MTGTRRWMRLLAVIGAVGAMFAAAPAAVAHPHKIATPHHEQFIGGGGNHPAFISGVSCADNAPAVPDGSPIGSSWYGLETAHHGPDAGTPGRGTGEACYQTTGSVSPGLDVENPVIK